MKLRRFICNKETEVTESGKLWEQMIHNSDYMGLVDSEIRPEIGLPIDPRFFKNNWFTELEPIEVRESKWWFWYEQEIKDRIKANENLILYHTKTIAESKEIISSLKKQLDES